MSRAREAFPFAVKVVLAFLALDALERVAQTLSLSFFQAEPDFVQAFVVALWIFIDLLLIFLLWVRSSAGRLWVLIVFAVHLLYVAQLISSDASPLWLSQDDFGRARLLLTLAIDGYGMHLISRPEARAFLCE